MVVTVSVVATAAGSSEADGSLSLLHDVISTVVARQARESREVRRSMWLRVMVEPFEVLANDDPLLDPDGLHPDRVKPVAGAPRTDEPRVG